MKAIQREDIIIVTRKLEELGERFALIGGCALPFVVDRAYVPTIRPTTDIDFVVEILTRLDYSKLEARLRALHFQHDARPGAPKCRWLVEGIQVDIISSSPEASELGSPWFVEGLESANSYELNEGLELNVIGPACLLATKIAAFLARGKNDYIGCEDMEDIVALLEGCSGLLDSVKQASVALRQYVSTEMCRLLETPAFIEAVPGHLSPESPPGSLERMLNVARQIAGGPEGLDLQKGQLNHE